MFLSPRIKRGCFLCNTFPPTVHPQNHGSPPPSISASRGLNHCPVSHPLARPHQSQQNPNLRESVGDMEPPVEAWNQKHMTYICIRIYRIHYIHNMFNKFFLHCNMDVLWGESSISSTIHSVLHIPLQIQSKLAIIQICLKHPRRAVQRNAGVIILPTQTMHLYKGIPSKIPYICIAWSPQNIPK